MSSNSSYFPGGSRSRVNKAGDRIRSKMQEKEDYEVIEIWRAAHRHVLNTFQAILRNRTKNKSIVVAQRHKRIGTIFDKLTRHSNMQLSRMDDVAGCRLIFESIDDLYTFRRKLHAAKFNHERKNDDGKYNYIETPKYSGYRGVHDVYSYDARSAGGRPYKGLLVEIQYRTLIQHAWATCVEVIAFVTENQPKFDRGDRRYQEIMRLSSEILARAHEDRKSSLSYLSNKEVVEAFLNLDNEINLLAILKGLNSASADFSRRKNIILIFSADSDLEIKTYDNAPEAMKELFHLETQHKNTSKDIVLVRGDSPEDVRVAFRNYFSDATEFIRLIEEGCSILSDQSGSKQLDEGC